MALSPPTAPELDPPVIALEPPDRLLKVPHLMFALVVLPYTDDILGVLFESLLATPNSKIRSGAFGFVIETEGIALICVNSLTPTQNSVELFAFAGDPPPVC